MAKRISSNINVSIFWQNSRNEPKQLLFQPNEFLDKIWSFGIVWKENEFT